VPGWDGLALPLHMQQRGIAAHAALALDHQARFFTGWEGGEGAKTPALGLTWANQVACRVALVKEAAWGGEGEGAEWAPRRWRRWMRVVFAAWAAPSEGPGVEFEIWAGGVKAAGAET
jgi:DNA repair protein RAD57